MTSEFKSWTVGNPMTSSEMNIAAAFIAAINRHSPSEISSLMTEDHAFVDSGGRRQPANQ